LVPPASVSVPDPIFRSWAVQRNQQESINRQ